MKITESQRQQRPGWVHQSGLAGIVFASVMTLLGSFTLASEPLKIGMTSAVTGTGIGSGRAQVQGAELAAREVNQAGGVLGRPLQFAIENDQSTNAGAVLAFEKLSQEGDIPAFIGPIRSMQILAIAQDVQKLGKPMMIAGTAPELTHMGNPWLFRCRPNDSYSARVIADCGVNALGKKKWAIVYSDEAFGASGSKYLIEALKALGVAPALVRSYSNNWQDSTPVATAVQQSGAEVLGTYMAFESDLAIFASQLRQLGINLAWVGSASIASTTALNFAGDTLDGSYGAVDFNRDTGPAAQEFAVRYQAAYGSEPDFFASSAYDAVHLLALAINNAGSLEPQKIREAILSVKGYAGAEGTYSFDPNGDGLHGYNIVRNDHGKLVFIKHIDFND
jgi:branched-chain amino acid transport system substrate-binding protein